MQKTCLIIDDEDQSADIEKLLMLGERRGVELECKQFNVGSSHENDMLTGGKIDIEKVIKEYKKRFRGTTFHIAAIDWQLSDDAIDGIELLRHFTNNKILRYTPKILYTGLLDEVLSSLLADFKKDLIGKVAVIRRIKILIKSGIKDFVGRENYEERILQLLESSDETMDLIIEEELRKFPDLKFNTKLISQGFHGKTFEEIAHDLDHNDLLRNGFKKEILQHVIAYLSEKL